MLRPNEITEKTFEKVDGGYYYSKDVDSFIQEIASSYEQVFKQNGELVRRLSLLANRLEAFRRQEELAKKASEGNETEVSDETIMNKLEQAKAVAQKMLYDARVKAIGIVNNANNESDRILVDLNEKIQEQRVALDLLNSKSDEFKKQLLDIYRQHLQSIDSIPSQAEKIVKENTSTAKTIVKEEKPEYKIDEDDSEVFERSDAFVKKLNEEKEANKIIEAEVSANPIDIKEEDADELDDIFSDAPKEETVNEISESAGNDSDDFQESSEDGFVFNFAGISFDDDEPDTDEEDSLDESSKEENDGFLIDKNAFSENMDSDEEADSDGISLKDIAKSKGDIESDNPSNDDGIVEETLSEDEFSNHFKQE